LSLRRAIGIEDAKAIALRSRQHDRAIQRRHGRPVQIAARPAIDRLAGEIVGRGIGKLDIDVMFGGDDGQQAHAGS